LFLLLCGRANAKKKKRAGGKKIKEETRPPCVGIPLEQSGVRALLRFTAGNRPQSAPYLPAPTDPVRPQSHGPLSFLPYCVSGTHRISCSTPGLSEWFSVKIPKIALHFADPQPCDGRPWKTLVFHGPQTASASLHSHMGQGRFKANRHRRCGFRNIPCRPPLPAGNAEYSALPIKCRTSALRVVNRILRKSKFATSSSKRPGIGLPIRKRADQGFSSTHPS